jgi:uncharacterized membrane protein
MTLRTKTREVTFRRAFGLKGVDGVLPAGTYSVETDEELLEQLSFPAYQRVSTSIRVPIGASRSSYQMFRVEPADLEEAERRDRQSGDTPA